VRSDIAFLDDVGSWCKGAFLGTAEQVADLGRCESLKSLDMLRESEQQALQVGKGKLLADPARGVIIPEAL
jgi:hypothetical protein